MVDTKISAMSAATSVLALVAAGVQGGANVKFDPTLLALLMMQPLNVGLTGSVGSSALTIALKGANGSDPSADNPVYVPFRSPTEGTGTPVVRTATAALSLVISSGSTLGFTSAKSCRLWVVIIDDAGTLRLGAFNASDLSKIYPLRDHMIMSSTAEGGAGAADSAGVLYTGTAATSKAIRILGYMDFSLTTAGTWDEVPDKVQIFEPGVPLPGDIVQTVFNGSGSMTRNPSVASYADVTNSSLVLTPTSAVNGVLVSYTGQLSASAGGAGINTEALVTLGRGAADLSGSPQNIAGVVSGAGTNQQTDGSIALSMLDLPNSASSLTYTCRLKGLNTSGTVTASCFGIAQEIMR